MKFLLIFFGGGLGALARYVASGVVHTFSPPSFPYGTFVVNCTGSLLIGVLATALDARFSAVPSLRFFLIIGLLGGFTTFSSFSYETMTLLREGSAAAALINVGASVTTCLAATWAGMMIGKAL